MPCEECAKRREKAGSLFDPACIWCGAALIQRIKMLPRPRQELQARMKAVLSDWVSYGHNEAEIRRLVAGPAAIQPTGQDAHGESESQRPTKPRSAPKRR